MIEQGKDKIPCNIEGSAIFHAGPIITGNKTSGFEIVAIGPTTSMRMNPYEKEVIEMGSKVIIGKGGMDNTVKEALKKMKVPFILLQLEVVLLFMLIQ